MLVKSSHLCKIIKNPKVFPHFCKNMSIQLWYLVHLPTPIAHCPEICLSMKTSANSIRTTNTLKTGVWIAVIDYIW